MGIPSHEDWGDYQSDLDQKSAYKIFYGKSNEEIKDDFYRDVLSRVSELRFMPKAPFQYYMIGFRDFVKEGNFRKFTEADVASSFLELIDYKLQNDIESILPIISELMPVVDYVAQHQETYGADEDIYGDFTELSNKIKERVS